jgi:hypothetical protein
MTIELVGLGASCYRQERDGHDDSQNPPAEKQHFRTFPNEIV